MRRTSIILPALVMIFSLEACTPKPPSLEERVRQTEPESLEPHSYTGVIESYPISLFENGTHRIRTDDGATVIQSRKVNLNSYLGKKATVEGSLQKMGQNTKAVFTVEKISAEGEALLLKEYKSVRWGLSFQYPDVWEVSEKADGAALRNSGSDRVAVRVFSLDTDFDTFIREHEIEDGISVTIAGERSMRYLEGNKMRLYIPHPSGKKAYRVIFNEDGEAANADREAFYAMLQTVGFSGGRTTEGEKCSGDENFPCSEGFRCELSGDQEGSSGVCAPLEGGKDESGCPFAPIPEPCARYEPKNVNLNGCPLSYRCLDRAASTESPLLAPGR